MSDLTHDIRALIGLLRDHPELLHEKANRESLHELVVVVRAALDNANLDALRVALADLEQERSPEE